MSTKLIETTSLALMAWLVISATVALAQHSDNPPVLDTEGHPLEPGQDYYITPAITDVGGRVTIVDNGTCPLFVGQENTFLEQSLAVFFTPFAKEDDVVKVNRDFQVAFSAATLCIQGTGWSLRGERDTESGRRLIFVGGDGRYFRVLETQSAGVYNIGWCPTDVCPFCKFDCGIVGGFRQNDGKIFLALDGNVLPVVFERAQYIEK